MDRQRVTLLVLLVLLKDLKLDLEFLVLYCAGSKHIYLVHSAYLLASETVTPKVLIYLMMSLNAPASDLCYLRYMLASCLVI
jgi:hypothetical protein